MDATRPEPQAQTQAGIGHHGLSGVRQQGQVCTGIANVIEFAGANAVEFVVSSEVGGAVRSQNSAEDTQMGGNAAARLFVRPGGEIDLSTPAAFLLKKL